MVLLALNTTAVFAQAREQAPIRLTPLAEPTSGPLSIEAAISAAIKNFPAVHRRQAEVQAASHLVKAQQFAEYMPQSNWTYQTAAGSHNRMTQSLFADPALPIMSGSARDAYDTMHGRVYSGSGVLLDWAPIDFGLHKARISETRALLNEARTTLALTQFDVAENAANQFLNLIVAREEVRAEESTVKRFEVLFDIVRRVVKSGLRPGVDESLAKAQLAQAQNRLYRAQQNMEIAEADLAESLGTPLTAVVVDTHPISEESTPPIVTVAVTDFEAHPLAQVSKSTVGTLLARERIYRKTYYPTIQWLGDMNFRGSGIGKDGRNEKYTAFGWAPAVSNWLVGVQVDFPFLDWFRIRQQTLAQSQRVTAERYHYQEIIQSLQAADRRSKALLTAAVRIAENMPQQVAAAQDAERRARTRYRAGLATIADVAETENVLTETLVEQAVARVGVWKALLAGSNARGDIKPFLAEVAAARNRGL